MAAQTDYSRRALIPVVEQHPTLERRSDVQNQLDHLDCFYGSHHSGKRREDWQLRPILLAVRRDGSRGIEAAEAGTVLVTIHRHLTGKALGRSGDEHLSLPDTLVVYDQPRLDVVTTVDNHIVVCYQFRCVGLSETLFQRHALQVRVDGKRLLFQ